MPLLNRPTSTTGHLIPGSPKSQLAGTWHATLQSDHASADCSPVTREIAVSARKPEPFRILPGSIWHVRNRWNSTNEALFSALIEKLFDAPPDQDLN